MKISSKINMTKNHINFFFSEINIIPARTFVIKKSDERLNL